MRVRLTTPKCNVHVMFATASFFYDGYVVYIVQSGETAVFKTILVSAAVSMFILSALTEDSGSSYISLQLD